MDCEENQMSSFIDYFLKIKDQEDILEDIFSENRAIQYEDREPIYDSFSHSKEIQQFKVSCGQIDFFTTSDGEEDGEEKEEPASKTQDTKMEAQAIVSVIPRQENEIETNKRIVTQRRKTKKGTRFQTHNLGYYFYRITLQKLKDKEDQEIFSAEQLQKIKDFELSKGNFNSFHNLFDAKRIKMVCLQFYSSPEIIKTIFQSPKLPFDKKLIMIKFIEKMRVQVESKEKNWKK